MGATSHRPKAIFPNLGHQIGSDLTIPWGPSAWIPAPGTEWMVFDITGARFFATVYMKFGIPVGGVEQFFYFSKDWEFHPPN